MQLKKPELSGAIARSTPEIKGIGLGQRRGFLHFDIGWEDGDRRREFNY